MNNLTKTFLVGAAFCAFAVSPAVAGSAGPFHITALNGGRVVNKTKLHNQGATHVTYSYGIYTSMPASTTVGTKWPILDMRSCSGPFKVNAPKKTAYGKINVHIDATSSRCEHVTGTYKLVKQPSSGDTDEFKIQLISRFEQNGTKYKETISLNSNLTFE